MRRPSRRTVTAVALIGLVMLAFNMRIAITAIPPIAEEISSSLVLGPAFLGLLGGMPPICFAVFGALAPAVIHRIGLDWAALTVLIAATAGHVMRGLAGDGTMLLIATATVFASCGVGNVVLTGLIKRYFPHRISTLTAMVGFIFSIAVSSGAVIVPLIESGYGWRIALGGWAIVAIAAGMPWLALGARVPGCSTDELTGPEARELGRVWHSPLARALAVIFAYCAFATYTYFTWLPAMIIELGGLPASAAGPVLGAYGMGGVVINIVLVAFGGRPAWELPLMIAGVIAFAGSTLGLLIAPTLSPWLWVVLAGLGPFLMQMVIVLIGVRAWDERETVALSSFVQSTGYAAGLAGPLITGWLHGLTGEWIAPLWLLLVLMIAPVIALRWTGSGRSPHPSAPAPPRIVI